MPALLNETLLGKLRAALPAQTRFETVAASIHPAVALIPGFGRARFYLWTVTGASGPRPPDEYKIQLIVDGQQRGTRGSLETEGAYSVLLGYSPDYGVFVGWESRLHVKFGYSAHVQVREDLLRQGRGRGWAVAAPRQLGAEQEVRVAFTPGNLLHFLRLSRRADREAQYGRWREALLLARAPNAESEPLPRRARALEAYIERDRQRSAVQRLERDARFGPRVKEQYDYSCAICGIQLEIVEAAHILPVSEPGSSDELWNGLALCPNHHTLFDDRCLGVASDLTVHVDQPTVAFLQESNRAEGLNLLTGFDGAQIRPPQLWHSQEALRTRMVAALDRRYTLSGIQAG